MIANLADALVVVEEQTDRMQRLRINLIQADKELDLWKGLVWQMREEINDSYEAEITDAGSEVLWGIKTRLAEMLEECELKLGEK